jgi:hypothetical protein
MIRHFPLRCAALAAVGAVALTLAAGRQPPADERCPVGPAPSAVELLPEFKLRLAESTGRDRALWQLAAAYVRLNEFRRAQDVLDAIDNDELRAMASAAIAVEGYSADPRKAMQLVRGRASNVLRAEVLTVVADLCRRDYPDTAQVMLLEAQGVLENAAKSSGPVDGPCRSAESLQAAID